MMFAIRKNVPLPVTQPNVNRLPFDWDNMSLGDSFFVPYDFWKSRVEEGTKIDLALAKSRIKGSFTTWKKATGKEKARATLTVLVVEERQKVDDSVPDEQANWAVLGTGVFLTTTTGDLRAEAEETEPAAPEEAPAPAPKAAKASKKPAAEVAKAA